MIRRVSKTGLAAGLVLAALPAAAQSPPSDARMDVGLPPILRAAAIEQRLDAQVPPGAKFRDERGNDIAMGDLLGQRPTILILAYYTCPMLCSQVLSLESPRKPSRRSKARTKVSCVKSCAKVSSPVMRYVSR